MTAIEWIRQYENYLALVKNRANNTVRSYVADAEILQRFAKVEDWGSFTEDMAVEYVRSLKQTSKDTSVSRKIYSLRQFFKFLRKKGVTTADPWGDIETHAIQRTLPQTLTINENEHTSDLYPATIAGVVGRAE
jgi:integrase/recombinase XerD